MIFCGLTFAVHDIEIAFSLTFVPVQASMTSLNVHGVMRMMKVRDIAAIVLEML